MILGAFFIFWLNTKAQRYFLMATVLRRYDLSVIKFIIEIAESL